MTIIEPADASFTLSDMTFAAIASPKFSVLSKGENFFTFYGLTEILHLWQQPPRTEVPGS